MTDSSRVIGVDACPIGWLATIIDGSRVRMDVYERFESLLNAHQTADQILIDIPIGLPKTERRQCDGAAKELLGSRGLSVFYPPCETAVELQEYDKANHEHRQRIGHGLSQQAHSISPKIREVAESVDQYDGAVQESHPELCFAALNNQPIAYSKSSDRGLGLRMKLLNQELEDAVAHYQSVRDEYFLKEVRRDDILDSMVLAVAARHGATETIPENPQSNEPRIHYPPIEVPYLEIS